MIIRESVTISAPMEIVWDVFSRVENWSDWNPVCRECRLDTGDRLSAGTCLSFTIKPMGFPIRISPAVKVYEKARRVSWAGSKWGLHAEHAFYFKPAGKKVRVESIEIFSGPMLLPAKFIGIPGRLHKLTRQLLAAMQTASESRFHEQSG
ncbi:MAG: SRPBCC family protein [Desulfobacterales bacterium]|nr:SRPBCC family protein [Desulfobacterales bacterium]